MKTREEPGSAASASYPGDESLRRSYPGDEDSSKPGIQVGARERRTVPAGHGFRVTTTIDDAADESEQNDNEHQRRLREAAAPRAGRSPVLSDDETRKRRRSPTKDNGRRVFGSRQLERLQSAMSAFRTEPLETEADSASRRRPGSHDDDSWRPARLSTTEVSADRTAARPRRARRFARAASGNAGSISWTHWGCCRKARVESIRSGRSERNGNAPTRTRRRQRERLREEQGVRRPSLSALQCKKDSKRRQRRRSHSTSW